MREECRIGGEQVRHPAQQILMHSEPREQQITVIGALVIDFVVGDDLLFGFLNLHHFAKLGRLGHFAFANDLGVRLEQTHELPGHMRIAFEETLAGLMHDLPHERDHLLQIRLGGLQTDLFDDPISALGVIRHLVGKAFGLPDHARSAVQELTITGLSSAPGLAGYGYGSRG